MPIPDDSYCTKPLKELMSATGGEISDINIFATYGESTSFTSSSRIATPKYTTVVAIPANSEVFRKC